MTPQPIYQAHNLRPAFSLRYTWTGWPSSGTTFPATPPAALYDGLAPLWEGDGLRVLEPTWTERDVKITFSTKPNVSPVFLASRAKGRLQHALRTHGVTCKFSRKVSVRSIGENVDSEVERYIREQVDRSDYVAPQFRQFLEDLMVIDGSVDLSTPTESGSGRYWYNLHLVLVTQQRHHLRGEDALLKVREQCRGIVRKKGYLLSTLALLPEHLHVALRADIEQSPEDVALAFQNNLAYALGQNAVWKYTYYTGTFGEYDMDAIRRCIRRSRGF